MLKPVTTLFMRMSLDGRIDSVSDIEDIDTTKDFLKFTSKESLSKDLCSLNTGKVMKNFGINEKTEIPEKSSLKLVIIDKNEDVNENGINYLCHLSDKVFLVTTNKKHPVFFVKNYYTNLEILYYENEIDLKEILEKLKTQYKIDQIAIQSGGVLKKEFLSSGLFDYLNIVVTPTWLGEESDTDSINSKPITTVEELNQFSALELLECNEVGESYVQLKYRVLHN